MRNLLLSLLFPLIFSSCIGYGVFRKFVIGQESLRADNFLPAFVWVVMAFLFGLLITKGIKVRGAWRIAAVVSSIIVLISMIGGFWYINKWEQGLRHKRNFMRECLEGPRDQKYCECGYDYLEKKNIFDMPDAKQLEYIRSNAAIIVKGCNYNPSVSFSYKTSAFKNDFLEGCIKNSLQNLVEVNGFDLNSDNNQFRMKPKEIATQLCSCQHKGFVSSTLVADLFNKDYGKSMENILKFNEQVSQKYFQSEEGKKYMNLCVEKLRPN